MCANCCSASSHAGTESHRGLRIVLLTLTLNNAALQHLILITFQRGSGSTAGFWSKLFFPQDFDRDTSELSGKKYLGSDSKCSRWGWSFLPAPNHHSLDPVSEATTHSQTRTPGSVVFVFLPDAIASFLGSSKWKVRSIYETSVFCGMRNVFPPLLKAEGFRVTS